MERARIHSVLVADDDEVLLAGLRRGLGLKGIETFTATNRGDAIELALVHKPDAALVDLQLGYENGLDLLRDLRHRFPAMLCILITGHSSTANTVEAMRAGAYDVLPKPCTLAEIVMRIMPGYVHSGRIETLSLDKVVYEHVHKVLHASSGNRSEAARRLRKPRSWLSRYLKLTAPKR
jgi:two-component system, response regulator RegA